MNTNKDFLKPNIWKISLTTLLVSMFVIGFLLQETSIIFQLILLIPALILLPLLFGILQPVFFSTGILDVEGSRVGFEDYIILVFVFWIYYYLLVCFVFHLLQKVLKWPIRK
ncbi:hypothetical protein A2165_03675 [Candidatus Curtissbacteria bacterium RBG_13_40_7]|uniref:Uncharacterized protein n=1 Tax=Candidatus Curtissbacteria bacterium RBG_13_40_7 TaxID=1797706 RepID=A0A1F5FVS8_9BACT|nr:MAG: hypothetical protein A2165_03675 [Candidatus Curtissbacteria bacterium RBG_13_40_7]